MNSFVHQGLKVEISAPYEVKPGDGILKGALFGISLSWAQVGESVEVSTTGVFDIERDPLENWQVGDRIFWNDNERRFTTLPKEGVLVAFAVADSSGQDRPFCRVKLIGYAT